MYYAIQPSTGSSKVSFAMVCIERIEKMFCSELTDEIAQIETYKTASELRSVLLKFYPDVKDDDELTIFHFRLKSKIE